VQVPAILLTPGIRTGSLGVRFQWQDAESEEATFL